MGIMGTATVTLMSRGYGAPRGKLIKDGSLSRKLSFCVEGPAGVDLSTTVSTIDYDQFSQESGDAVHGLVVKSVDDEVDGVLNSEWWGCRELVVQRDSLSDDIQSTVEVGEGDKGGDGDDVSARDVLELPDDVMSLIFARMPRQSFAMSRLVCSSWKRVAEQQELAALRREMGVTEGWIYVLAETPEGDDPFRAYDPVGGKWSVLPPTPGRSRTEQWQGFACVAVGHKLLLIGGTRAQKIISPTTVVADRTYCSSASAVCSDVVIYDALTNKWSRGANMVTPRSWFAAAVVAGKVYVAGGQGKTKFLDSGEVYDPVTDTWAATSRMSIVRSSCQGFSLGGQFWVIAGEYVKNVGSSQRSSAEVYDPKTDSWRFLPNMYLDDNKVMQPSAVSTPNGELICVHQKRIMAYKQGLNSWTQLGHISGGEEYARPTFSRFGFACESVGGKLYIIGGTREHSSQNRHRYCTPLNTVEVCELDGEKQYSSQLWWKLGSDMGSGTGGVISASVVSWL